MNATKMKTIDDLPDLPFEKVLSYLSVEDRLKSRAVSRGWYQRINSCKVNSLCCSARPFGFIYGKRRWVTGAFARNFIGSRRFECFLNTFRRSILSDLKRLRLCKLDLDEVDETRFTSTLNSFDQLEEVDIIHFGNYAINYDPVIEFELNLPMLNSIQLEKVYGIKKLTLDAPRLSKVRLWHCSDLSLVIVHGESVERLLTEDLNCTAVKNLKNLKSLCTGPYRGIDPTLLSSLDQLKEIHLNSFSEDVKRIFEQKQRYGRTDLKIYFRGFLLNGAGDAAVDSLGNKEAFVRLTENLSRSADEIPLCNVFVYSTIEYFDSKLAIDLMSRFSGWDLIFVGEPIQNIDRFLNFLKNFDNIEELEFSGDQPQDLFDRLPEHCTIQRLEIEGTPSDFKFLSRLKELIDLDLHCPINAELIRKLFELPFLSYFSFKYDNEQALIRMVRDSGWTYPKRFQVSIGPDFKWVDLPDLETAIQFIFETASQRL